MVLKSRAAGQILMNYAHLLEENKHFEDSFRVYEKASEAYL